jgi:hypothetical protein
MKNFFLKERFGRAPGKGDAACCLTCSHLYSAPANSRRGRPAYLYSAFANRFCATHMPATHSASR